MRKSYLLFVLMFFVVSLTRAEKVDVATAEKVGKAFIYEQLVKTNMSITFDEVLIEETFVLNNQKGDALIYVFNLSPEGFVLVGADDIFRPILGYSLEQTYNPAIENKNFKNWTSSYMDEFAYCVNKGIKTSTEFKPLWEKYNTTSDTALHSADRMDEVVSPLLSCKWNQDNPYNMLCPEDGEGPGGHVYAGCVATAMSQIMYYYRYPEQGTGSHSYYCMGYGTLSVNFGETNYQWEGMMDQTASFSYDSEYAIGELMYHCGVAVDMGYGADGSGAFSGDVPAAIKDYFGYDQSAQYKLKNGGTSWDSWMEDIREQLDAQHPVYYKGRSDEGGHAFVCDGYDDNDMFHFNFGWSSSGDGFFPLTGTEAVGGYGTDQGMIINFIPDTDAAFPYHCSGDTDLTYSSGSFEDGSGPIENYEINSECSWLIQPKTEFDSIEKIDIYFREFDLEQGADVVTIYNGATTSDDIVGQYSGSDLPDNLSIENNHVLVTFESDANDAANAGFRIEYETSAPSYCNSWNSLTDPVGVVSDGSEMMNHSDNAFCQFMIAPPSANSVTLTFNVFDLGDEGDYVQVYQASPMELLAEYAGGDTPEAVTSTTGEMLVIFKTNNHEAGQGFEAEYSMDIAVGRLDLFKDLVVYPNPTSGMVNISFELENESKALLQLIDITGKIIYQNKIEGYSSAFYSDLDVSEFDKGIYILNITTPQGAVREKLIIK